MILVAAMLAAALVADPAPLSPDQSARHVLNRLGYGARPGDLERVEKMGVEKYIREQLFPGRIDDTAVEKKLAAFQVLEMDAVILMKQLHEEQRAMAELKREREKNPNAKPADTFREMLADGTIDDHYSRYAVGQLQNAKIIRAAESNRQLQEVLVDFWSNHFNIDARKQACRVLKVVDERDAIRPHVFGSFRDLLAASATSPAMLIYLDNAQNSTERTMKPAGEKLRKKINAEVPGALPAPGLSRKAGGINENYAREIMELHTLGVDGGYTQKDVQEVARCFTGWGIDLPTGQFRFHSYRHDDGSKVVLGQTIPSKGGNQDVELVLDILANHPATAKFIATKLCQRLVADEPPPALIARVAVVFRQTQGDLRKVYEAILFSPEFHSTLAYRAKIKSPFEFAVSAVRASGATITTNTPMSLNARCAIETGATFGRGGARLGNAKRKSLNLALIELGQPLYAFPAPTGYPEDSRKWVNTGALIARMNFALTLSERGVLDVVPHPDRLLGPVDTDDADAVIDRLNQVLLQNELTPATRATLEKQRADAATVNVPQLTALILGSPEFQRR